MERMDRVKFVTLKFRCLWSFLGGVVLLVLLEKTYMARKWGIDRCQWQQSINFIPAWSLRSSWSWIHSNLLKNVVSTGLRFLRDVVRDAPSGNPYMQKEKTRYPRCKSIKGTSLAVVVPYEFLLCAYLLLNLINLLGLGLGSVELSRNYTRRPWLLGLLGLLFVFLWEEVYYEDWSSEKSRVSVAKYLFSKRKKSVYK